MAYGFGYGYRADRVTRRVGEIITVPSQMTAPILSAPAPYRIDVKRAPPPFDGGSPITSYEVRLAFSSNVGQGMVFDMHSDPHVFGADNTVLGGEHFIQTRALNAIGPGPWSEVVSIMTLSEEW